MQRDSELVTLHTVVNGVCETLPCSPSLNRSYVEIISWQLYPVMNPSPGP